MCLGSSIQTTIHDGNLDVLLWQICRTTWQCIQFATGLQDYSDLVRRATKEKSAVKQLIAPKGEAPDGEVLLVHLIRERLLIFQVIIDTRISMLILSPGSGIGVINQSSFILSGGLDSGCTCCGTG